LAERLDLAFGRAKRLLDRLRLAERLDLVFGRAERLDDRLRLLERLDLVLGRAERPDLGLCWLPWERPCSAQTDEPSIATIAMLRRKHLIVFS
jgi:hypothetical protein